MTVLSHLAGFGGADVVQGLVHFGDDVEAIEDVKRLRAFLPDHLQVRLPHIRADELDLGREFLPDHGEEALEGFHGPFLAHPEQAGAVLASIW